MRKANGRIILKHKHPEGTGYKRGLYPRADKPLWAGDATIAMARKVYGIKTPDEFREPSLFDFGMSDENLKIGSGLATT
jgi:hypothetical protein